MARERTVGAAGKQWREGLSRGGRAAGEELSGRASGGMTVGAGKWQEEDCQGGQVGSRRKNCWEVGKWRGKGLWGAGGQAVGKDWWGAGERRGKDCRGK